MAAGRLDVSRRGYDRWSRKDHGLGDHGVERRNNYHSTSSNVHKIDFRRSAFSCANEERDVGELSRRFRDDKVSKIEDGVQMPPEKKRKFSPIVWDLEEKRVRTSLQKSVADTNATVSCDPSPASVVSDGDSAKNSVSPSHSVKLGNAVDEKSTEPKFPPLSSSSLHLGKHGDHDQEEGQVEEEEFSEVRNISLSRWASEDDSPHVDMLGQTVYNKMSSPESGEFRREGSSGYARSSSSSDHNSWPVSKEEDISNKLDGDELMDSEDMLENNATANLSESNADDSYIEEHTAATERRHGNLWQSCRSVFEFERLNEISEGTYGKVFKAKDKKTGELVALKKVKMNVGGARNLEEYGFPLSALREINILLSLQHPSIVNLKEVAMDGHDGVYMVMEYMEHDLKGVMQFKKQPFSSSEVKSLMLQLLEGVKYLHDNWVIHRDLKTSNLLMNNQGELKICDFGMSRQYGSPLKPYTSLVVTLWYRAPELLLGTKQYSTATDMWSVGCIMAELLSKEALFKGKNEIDQIDKIFRMLGTPNEKIWPGLSRLKQGKAKFVEQPYNLLRKKFPAASFTGLSVLSDLGFDLLNRLLTYDPEKRITADAALNHPWFREVPLPKSKEFMPTFPPQHARN